MQIEKAGKNLIKSLSSLKIKKFREESGKFLVEGEKLCEELFKSDYSIDSIIISSNFVLSNSIIQEAVENDKIPAYTASEKDFDRLCETKTPQGIVAVAFMKRNKPILEKPFIILDSISDPGNLGTIIRSADWFGFQQVILGQGSASVYNGKVLRSSMGSVFHLNIIEAEDLRLFIVNNFPSAIVFAASVDAKTDITKITKPDRNFGIIFGNEARGISDDIEIIADKKFKISGKGRAESLNVAVAAGISLAYFEKFLD